MDRIQRKNREPLPPLTPLAIIKGIVFIALLVTLSFGASRIAVPHMIAFTLHSPRLAAIAPDDLRAAARLLARAGTLADAYGVDRASLWSEASPLDAERIAAAARHISEGGKYEPHTALDIVIRDCGLRSLGTPALRERMRTVSPDQVRAAAAGVLAREGSLAAYTRAGKIILRDALGQDK